MGVDADGNEIVETTEETSSGDNPSWQELYGVLPDSLHSVVAPVLKKWESGTQAKFEQYAESQKAYEPYQQFIDNGVQSSQIEQALSIAQMIDTDPQGFMVKMNEFFGDKDPQTKIEPVVKEREAFDTNTSAEPYDLSADVNFKKISDQQDVIAGYLSQQVAKEEAAKADAELSTQVDNMTKKYGAFDEDYVFGKVMAGAEMEDAVKSYVSLVTGIRSKPTADANLPNILSPTGGLPSEQVNVTEMSPKERRAYVMSILAQANQT